MSEAGIDVSLTIALFMVGMLIFCLKGRKHNGWAWTQAPHQIRRWSYIQEHFGGWEAIRKVSTYKNGVHHINIPPELQAKIDADPLCHPPGKRKVNNKLGE